jgi:hypothetical protein
MTPHAQVSGRFDAAGLRQRHAAGARHPTADRQAKRVAALNCLAGGMSVPIFKNIA